MPWSDELIDHYQRPRNWGSFHHREKGLIMTGIDECLPYRDFFGIQFKIATVNCPVCKTSGKIPSAASGSEDIEFINCESCTGWGTHWIIEDVRHITVGCGWLIAVGSWLSEYLKDRRVEEALALRDEEIMDTLQLPWATIHCSTIAWRAIRDALLPGFECLMPPRTYKR